MAEFGALESLNDWPKMRRKIESAVQSVLGELPKNQTDPQMKIAEELEFPGFVRCRINYFVDDWDRISAWLFVPEDKEEGPAIICCHQMTPLGKDEAAGIEGDPRLALARHYAEQGYAAIAPDCITAGDRVSSGLAPFDTKNFYADNPDLSVVGKMLADHMKCVDVLTDLPQVDASRIGVIGHDMGAYNALFLVAFDERVQVAVASGGFTPFAGDKDCSRWALDSGLVLLPKLREAIAKKSYPFDWDHVLSLVAPSPTLLITALNDEVLSNTKGCAKVVNRARKVYKLFGADNALENFTHDGGHDMGLDALEAADEWFERWL